MTTISYPVMHSPALGIGYSLWLRLRWIVGSSLTAFLVLAAMVNLFPATAEAGSLAALLLAFATLLPLLNTFTLGPVDLGVRASGYPRHMMVLPMSNRALVGWPMLYAAMTNAGLWVVMVTLIFNRAGHAVPIIWPASMIVATCAWLQAIGWTPFPSPFARVPVFVIALFPLSLVPLIVSIDSELAPHSGVIVVCSIGWTLAAYAVGVYGLSRARRGNEGDWVHKFVEHRIAKIRGRIAGMSRTKPPFRSAFAAQLWHECRRNAISLPMILSFAAVPMVPGVCLAILNPDNDGIMIGSVQIMPAAFALAVWFGVPLLLCGVYGPDMAKFDIWGKAPMTSFFAIRPMTTTRFIVVKVTAVLVSVAITWGIIVVVLSILLGLEASSLNPRESMVRAAWAEATPGRITLVSVMLIGYLALMWRNIVIGMWPALTGRKWFATAITAALFIEFGLTGAAAAYVYHHPEIQPRIVALVPWLLFAAVVLKLGAAAGVIAALRREALMESRVIHYLVGLWVAVCAFLFLAIGLVSTPTMVLTCGIVLFVPFTRLMATPLALQWNRHR